VLRAVGFPLPGWPSRRVATPQSIHERMHSSSRMKKNSLKFLVSIPYIGKPPGSYSRSCSWYHPRKISQMQIIRRTICPDCLLPGPWGPR
jgi:hypothetical protein